LNSQCAIMSLFTT